MTALLAFGLDSLVLGQRTLRRFYRVPANPLGVILYPLIQLLVFSQLFKDIVQLPGFETGSYLAYLAPGQVVFAVFFAVTWSGGNLLYDYRAGMLDKLRAAPISRYAILAGEFVPLFVECALMAGIILVVSVALGAPMASGPAGAVVIMVLGGAFGVAWSGTSFVPALITKNEQATGTLALLFFPIAFMSTAFVPEALMPEWLQTVNQWNPISHVIEAMRALMIIGFDLELIGRAALWVSVLALVLHSVTLWAFRRLTA